MIGSDERRRWKEVETNEVAPNLTSALVFFFVDFLVIGSLAVNLRGMYECHERRKMRATRTFERVKLPSLQMSMTTLGLRLMRVPRSCRRGCTTQTRSSSLEHVGISCRQ